MDQFDALARSGELHQMLADDIAGTQAGVMHRGARRTGRLAQGQRGARGCILLVDVVGLDHVAVPTAQRRGRALDQFGQHRHAQAEVGGPRHRYPGGRLRQRFTLGFSQAGGARDQRDAALRAQRQHRIETFRQAEIDGDVERRHAPQFTGGEIRHALHHPLGGRFAHHRRRDLELLRLLGGQTQQGLAHAPGSAVDEETGGRDFHARHGSRASPAGEDGNAAVVAGAT